MSMETGQKRLPHVGYRSYRPHLADWSLPEGSCKIPRPFQDLQIYHESFRGWANETFFEHVSSLLQREDTGELKQKCSEIMSVLQDGLHWSAFGMDFSVLQLKRRSLSVEWNASQDTPLSRFLQSTERDVREVLDWYFDKRGEVLDFRFPIYHVRRSSRTSFRHNPQKLSLSLVTFKINFSHLSKDPHFFPVLDLAAPCRHGASVGFDGFALPKSRAAGAGCPTLCQSQPGIAETQQGRVGLFVGCFSECTNQMHH